MDNQVKVRGYRIELGEIENVLQGEEEVEQAVVLARERRRREEGEGEEGRGEGGGVGKRLVAYVAVREEEGGGGEKEVKWEELRERVKGQLPEYMVPSGWVMVEKLPLTANGKVDRRALLELEEEESGRGREGEGEEEEEEGGGMRKKRYCAGCLPRY